MLCERIWSFLSLLASVACTIVFFLLAATGRISNLPALYMNSPGTTALKYHTELAFPSYVTSIAWSLLTISMIATAIYIIIASSDFTFFPAAFFLCWITGEVGSIAWTFTFDLQQLEECVTLTAVVMVCYSAALGIGCYRSLRNTILAEEGNLEELPEKFKFWYRYLIMGSLGIWSTWSVIAFAVTLVMKLAYLNSLDEIQARPGEYSLSAASTIGYLIIAFFLGLWMLLDLYLVPRYTACVRTIYGFCAFCTGSMLYKNFYLTKGPTTNNYICLAIFVCSFTMAVWKFNHSKHKKMQ